MLNAFLHCTRRGADHRYSRRRPTMYARITPFRFDPAQDKEDETRRLGIEQLVPALQQLPGFRSYSGTLDRNTPGRGYAISLWDTAQQAEGARATIGSLISQFQGLGLEFEPTQVHEVSCTPNHTPGRKAGECPPVHFPTVFEIALASEMTSREEPMPHSSAVRRMGGVACSSTA
jgi:quinol monooxygenase YgiN